MIITEPTPAEIAAHQKRMAELRDAFTERWNKDWSKLVSDAVPWINGKGMFRIAKLLWDAFRAGAEIGGKL